MGDEQLWHQRSALVALNMAEAAAEGFLAALMHPAPRTCTLDISAVTLRPKSDRAQLSGETLVFLQRLWAVVQGLNTTSKRMERELHVTGPQRMVVRVLGRSPGRTSTELAATLGLHPSTLTGILKRLLRDGFVQREVDASDRRRAEFRLTTRGRELDRERKGTVEAAVRRALVRADRATIERTMEMLELIAAELARRD